LFKRKSHKCKKAISILHLCKSTTGDFTNFSVTAHSFKGKKSGVLVVTLAISVLATKFEFPRDPCDIPDHLSHKEVAKTDAYAAQFFDEI